MAICMQQANQTPCRKTSQANQAICCQKMKQQASYKGEKHNCKEELVVTFDLSQPFTLELQVVSDYS